MKPPEQQAQAWVRTETSWVDKVPSDLAGIPYEETWLCEANDCKRAFLAGHLAGQEHERNWWTKKIRQMIDSPGATNNPKRDEAWAEMNARALETK